MIEHIVSSVFADALSRVGSFRSFDPSRSPDDTLDQRYSYYNRKPNSNERIITSGDPLNPPPSTSRPFTTFNMLVSITGYGHKAAIWTDWLAAALLFVHLAVATSHVLYMLIVVEALVAGIPSPR
jgi:hypothetical protein